MASDHWRVGPQPPFSQYEQKQSDLRRAYDDRQRERDERAARTKSEHAAEFNKIAAIHYLDDEQFKERFAHYLAQNIAERGVDLRQISSRDMNGIIDRSLDQTYREEEHQRQEWARRQQEPEVQNREKPDTQRHDGRAEPEGGPKFSPEQMRDSEERLQQSIGHYDALREAEATGHVTRPEPATDVTAARRGKGQEHLPVEATLKLQALFESPHDEARTSQDEALTRQREESTKRQEAELAAGKGEDRPEVHGHLPSDATRKLEDLFKSARAEFAGRERDSGHERGDQRDHGEGRSSFLGFSP
jgi:hypothetical protein